MNPNIDYLAPMFLQARGFKKVFDSLNQEYINQFINNKSFSSNDADFMPVTATTGAFACELYLKCIFIYEHRNDEANIKYSHKIYSLFKRISKNNRNAIIKFLESKYSLDEKSFLNKLELSNNDFTAFRYLFEQKNSMTLQLDFFPKFLDALDTITLNIINSFDFPKNINLPSNDIIIAQKGN